MSLNTAPTARSWAAARSAAHRIEPSTPSRSHNDNPTAIAIRTSDQSVVAKETDSTPRRVGVGRQPSAAACRHSQCLMADGWWLVAGG